MAITDYYTNTFTLYRQVVTGNTSTEASQGTFVGHLQQLTIEQLQTFHDNIVVTHRIWCPADTDIQLSDTVELGSDRYGVKAIQNNGFIGDNAHLEVYINKLNDLPASV